jgi:hypothetical protein
VGCSSHSGRLSGTVNTLILIHGVLPDGVHRFYALTSAFATRLTEGQAANDILPPHESRFKAKLGVWPQTASGSLSSSLALGDIDGDAIPEVVGAASDGRVYAWKLSGQPVPGWPVATAGPISSSPSLVDLDADGRCEIAVGSNDRDLHIWSCSGASFPGWPRSTGGAISSSPCFWDLDGDGLLEVAVGSADTKLHIWQLAESQAPDAPMPWPRYRHDACRSGSFGFPRGPTNVLFVIASAVAENGYVALSWRTIVDIPVSAFLIQRSNSAERNFITLDLPISEDAGSSFFCTDYSVQPGKTYWYNIVLVGPSGEESYGPIEVHLERAPTALRVYQSYPNPFNPLCTIIYDIPRAGRVGLRVFDVSGSLVRTLADGWREPGVYSEVWDGKRDDGRVLPSGVYFYRLEAGDLVAIGRMVLLK